MARRKSTSRTRTIVRKVRSSKRGGGIKNILRKVMIGFGAGSAGQVIANRTGINPLLPSAGLGYIAGGWQGMLSAIALPLLLSTGTTGGIGNILGMGAVKRAETSTATVWGN
jgi:hypothetical protein